MTPNKILETGWNGLVQILDEGSYTRYDFKELGKGIGPVTVSIFLRELRDIWHKANSKLTPLVILTAKTLGIIKTENPEQALKELKTFWTQNKIEGKTFVNFETALLRYGKDLRRKERRRMH